MDDKKETRKSVKTGKDIVQLTVKEDICTDLYSLVAKLQSMLQIYMWHVNNISHQYKCMLQI